MIKTMPYSLYRNFYHEFPAENYNKAKKTIDVMLPDYVRPKFPKEWRKDGNHYFYNGCTITVWNTGYAENFVVETGSTIHDHESITIPAGLYARERAITIVNEKGAVQ